MNNQTTKKTSKSPCLPLNFTEKIPNVKIREGWREVRLGDMMEIIGGGTPKTNIPEYWNGDIPWLSPPDFTDSSRWVDKSRKSITELGLKNSATKLLRQGDVIISARGTVGALAQLRKPISKMQREKKKEGKLYPYYGAVKIMDYVNDYIFDGEYVLMAEDGTVKTDQCCPILQYASSKFWVNNHTHILKAKKPYGNFFLWHFLLRLNIERYITGAVQPKINQENLISIKFPKYPAELILKFQETARPIFGKILKNESSIYTLENLRDTLLPRLMSGKRRIDILGE